MKIAILDPASFALPYVVFFARGLRSSGHEVSLFCSRTKYNESLLDELAAEQQIAKIGVNLYRVSHTAASSRWRGVLAYGNLLMDVFRRRRSIDVVNVQFGIFLPFDVIFMIVMRRQIQFAIHDDVPHGFTGTWHAPTLVRAYLAKSLIFTSAAVMDRFFQRYPLNRLRGRAKLLQHGLLAATLQPQQAEPALAEGSPIITFFGTVKPYKGVEQLVVATPLLEKSLAVEIHGQWDPTLKDLKKAALAHGCIVKDEYLTSTFLERILMERRVFVLPYRDASQSGVLYLLLNYARPFVSTDRGDLGAFLKREGLAQLIFNMNDPESLAKALTLAKSTYDDISRQLRLARHRYEWEAVIAASGIYKS
jgi:glycosyltransferase involved in cell wall biosynthesis